MKGGAAPAAAAPAPGARRGAAAPDASSLHGRLRAEIAAGRSALAAVAARDFDETVHGVRKRLKLARSTLRLIATPLGEAAPAIRDELRAAARALAGARDAAVLAATARALARKMHREVDRALLGASADRAAAHAATRPDIADAGRHLEAAVALVEKAHLGATAELSMRLAAAKLYRRARKGWRAALDSPDAETLHEWRKRVKDRLHLARLFARAWPEERRPRAKKLDRLGEWLGLDHDLAVLAEALGEDAGLARIRHRIARRRAKLQAKAFALGEKLFRDKAATVRAAWATGQGLMR